MIIRVTDLVVNTDEIVYLVPFYQEDYGRFDAPMIQNGWELHFKNESAICITDLQYLELVGKL